MLGVLFFFAFVGVISVIGHYAPSPNDYIRDNRRDWYQRDVFPRDRRFD